MEILKNLKSGDMFTLKNVEYPTDNQVYVKGAYDRSERKYLCYKYGDVCCERLLRGDRVVFTDFIF